MARLGLERVYFVPTGQSPHKLGRHITSATHRLAMIERAVASNPSFAVSTVELERPGPSYTVDTLAQLRDQWGRETQLAFILGWDMLLDLPNWRRPEAIVETVARIAAIQRPGYSASSADLEAVLRALPGLHAKLVVLPVPQLGISASELRGRVASSLPIRYLVPDGVVEYIAEHRLYRSGALAAAHDAREPAGEGNRPAMAPDVHLAHNVHGSEQEAMP